MAKRWYLASELLNEWGMQPFEFIDLIRNGKLQPYVKDAEKEKKIRHELSDDEIQYLLDNSDNLENIPGELFERISPDIQREHFNEEAFENGIELQGFLDKLIFKAEDINHYEAENNIHHITPKDSDTPSPAAKAQPAETIDIESLSMTYISDNEIKIRHSKATKIYDKKQLGFKKQGNSKIWNEFVKALESKDHFYYVGKSKTASYELAQKNLKDINEKLISFFNKEYPFKLPNNFKLYENVKSEKPGTYKFKFAINNPSDINNKYDNLSKDDLISKIEKLSEQFSEYEKNGNDKEADKTNIELSAAVETAMNKGFIGNNRAKGYLFPNRID
jgi:hypothetical protein